MCGLAGFIDAQHVRRTDALDIARRMGATLRHRGPDDEGVWCDEDAGLAIAHRRLAIVDLSAAGHQPMLSPSGRFVIAYNGEIYNFVSLRRELEGLGARFRGSSDTEVLLTAIDQWGVDATLTRINGMFAFALWDRQARVLHLIRDRLGKKPLYFGWSGRSFLFASELKAFHAYPDFVPELDRAAVALLLRSGHVPSPYSIYKGIFKLSAAGHLPLRIDGHSWQESPLDRVRTYWSLREVASRGVERPLEISDAEAVGRLEDLLTEAVARRMIADVPLGAFLSGGIDSSLVVALMQKCSPRPVKTFTIGFHETGYDEAQSAKQVALHLGTDHHELYVTPRELQEVIPSLPQIYDEPFADQSQIPTFLVSQFTRGSVTVALSGDGGDEVFAGYNRYSIGPRLWRVVSLCPSLVRRGLAGLLTSTPPERWDVGFDLVYRCLPRSMHLPTIGYQLHKLANLLLVGRPEQLYERLTSRWTTPSSLVIGADEPGSVIDGPGERLDLDDLVHRMMYYDTLNGLPDDILVKVDRASMAVSLEVRAPLLDHEVVEFAWRLPRQMKVHRGQGKLILRRILARHVPVALFDRPKQGFAVPLDRWLRGSLRDWAQAMLDPHRIHAEGIFEPAQVRHTWEDHLSGRGSWADRLWCILMFQAWLEHWHHGQSQRTTATESPRTAALATCLDVT